MNNIIRLESPVTWTVWIWNIVKRYHFNKSLLNHPNLQWECTITDLYSYSLLVNERHAKPWSRPSSDVLLLNKFKKLWIIISNRLWSKADPINYIIKLYYSDLLSIEDITIRLNDMVDWTDYEYWEFQRDTLRKVLNDTFKWKLFPKTYIRPATSKKYNWLTEVIDWEWNVTLVQKKSKWAIIQNISRDKENIEEANIILNKLNKNPDFNIEEFKWKKSKWPEKLKFLYKTYFSTTVEEILKNMKTREVWNRRLAKILQIVVNELSSEEFKLNEVLAVTPRLIQTIVEWINK
jgi:hypothetical protein